MTKEEYEFYEDFMMNTELATKEEVAYVVDEETVITHSGEVKTHPQLTDYINYTKAKNKQKRNDFLNQKRKNTLRLVK